VAGTAAARRALLESLLSIPLILGGRVSNRRDKIAFCTNQAGRFELYSLSFSTPEPVRLTHGEVPRSPLFIPVWSRDDRGIVFGRDQDGDELHDLYRLGIDSGELERLTHDRTCTRYAVEFTPDDKWLLFISDKGGEGEARQLDYWRLPLDGGPMQRLTHHTQPVFPWYTRNVYRSDGARIAYGASDSLDSSEIGIFVAEADGSEAELTCLPKPGSKNLPAGWSPDGKTLAFSSDAFDRTRTGLLDVGSREVRWIAPGPYDEFPVEFSADGRSLLAVRTFGLRVRVAVYDLVSGRATLSPFNISYVGEVAFVTDGREVLAIRKASGRPNEIVCWNVGSGDTRVLWSPRFGSLRPESFANGRIVRYPAPDGREIEALDRKSVG
jgi:Tol biopolymer transport system component